MEFLRLDPQTVLVRNINAFAAGLLRQIPVETDPGDNAAARDRLFSPPVAKGQGSKELRELAGEWKQYVEPDLQHLFQSSNETVSDDLRQMHLATNNDPEGEEAYTLHIPVAHLEQWLNSLNQARLVMATRNAFTEQELDAPYPIAINSLRDMNLWQIHFYGEVQHFLIREVERTHRQ